MKRFLLLCYDKQFEKAKLFYDSNPGNIRLYEYRYAFEKSCVNGDIEFAKWIWSLGEDIDIRMNGDMVFRLSCMNGHLEVVKWLLTLCNNYEIEEQNGKIVNYWIRQKSMEECINKKINRTNEECSICSTQKNKMINFNCKGKHQHIYCLDCIQQSMDNNYMKDNCLLCMTKINYDDCIFIVK